MHSEASHGHALVPLPLSVLDIPEGLVTLLGKVSVTPKNRENAPPILLAVATPR